jgi:NH3-dependent NAD+ synthetase
VAVDALEAEHARCVTMPSSYTSQDSLEDAAEVARPVGRTHRLDRGRDAGVFGDAVGDLRGVRPERLRRKNIQARLRGLVLMAISNKLGYMLLTTSNKSEMSVG